jgi:hypothetical protein
MQRVATRTAGRAPQLRASRSRAAGRPARSGRRSRPVRAADGASKSCIDVRISPPGNLTARRSFRGSSVAPVASPTATVSSCRRMRRGFHSGSSCTVPTGAPRAFVVSASGARKASSPRAASARRPRAQRRVRSPATPLRSPLAASPAQGRRARTASSGARPRLAPLRLDADGASAGERAADETADAARTENRVSHAHDGGRG